MRYNTGAADDITARRLWARHTDLQSKDARSKRGRFVRRVFAIGRIGVKEHRECRLFDTRVIVAGITENIARCVGHIDRAGIARCWCSRVICIDLQLGLPVFDVEEEGVRPYHGRT